jgi:VanZ family protein
LEKSLSDNHYRAAAYAVRLQTPCDDCHSPMKTFYFLASAVPRRIYLAVAVSLYLLMLILGAIEPTVDALPGREDYSKVYHVLFYSGLSGLLWFGVRNASVGMITVLIALAGAIDEIHQYFLPFRHARVSDVLLDTVAGLVAALILHHMRRRTGLLSPARSHTRPSP